MNSFWWSKCLCILFMALGANSETYYSINAPGVIKSNRKYSVVATLHEATGPCAIRVGIEGPNFKEFKDVTLQPFEFQLVEFFPNRIQEGKYYLKSEGLTGCHFKNESEVAEITHDGSKIFIQTDKAIYKPQDLVNFRFLILDEHTRPLKLESPISVTIKDANDNQVKHFQNVSLTCGIFTGRFQLSKHAISGAWLIVVKADGPDNYFGYKVIYVFEYVLPKFSVYLETASNVLLEDGYVHVVVHGKYSFGRSVEGNATVELRSGDRNVIFQTQQLDIQTFGSVDFNLKTIKNIDKYEDVCIVVYLSEKYTAKTEHSDKWIYLRRQRYNLSIPETEIQFENNKPYSITVNVKHWTGAPVFDRKTPVTMKHGYNMYESFLDKTGAATFEFDYDANANYNFQYKDSQEMFPVIETSPTLMLNSRKYYCRLKLLDKDLKFGKPVQIEVTSMLNIPYLMYIIMGHASLVHTEYIKVPSNQTSHTISITPTIDMIPQSFVYVFYVHDGNLRYEEIILRFPEEFENQISLSAPKQVKPNENVTITVNAQPKSYVGIMAVDLRVYMLDSSYDLDRQQIIKELLEERSYSPIGSAEYPGVISGLITLTNAHYLHQQLDPPTQHFSGTAPVHNYRQQFPETLIFETYLINDTETKLTLQIPDTITTWRITAFTNDAATGFGIVDAPTDITTIQTFFISLNLPYAVKRGEIVAIPVTIFNYSNQTLDTEVILLNTDKEFYFLESKGQDVEKSSDEQYQKQRIGIAENTAKTAKFYIFPIKSGEINIKVLANTSLYSDAVLQKLKVDPEGVPKQKNRDLYLSIPKGEQISSTLEIPNSVESVPDSEFVTFSVGGHYLVPTVDNFQDLTQMPTGSGEQNIMTFAPSILILQYLRINGKLSKEKDLVESLKSAIELGYQTQLGYRHKNGGYSLFGIQAKNEPSSWLTAFVVRYFIKALEFVEIESSIIEADLEYLASQQTMEGEFLCTGCMFHQRQEQRFGLTAFILLSFLENEKIANKYQQVIEKGIEFLKSNLNNVDDTRQVCLVATAMKRYKLRDSEILIDKINKHSKKQKGLKYWSAGDRNPANDIELTANAALTLLETPGDHTSILKWLIAQRNPKGGFISGYDTVAGLEALVKFSEKYANIDDVNLKVSYTAKDEQGNEIAKAEFHVDSKNVLHFQKHELPRGARQVTFNMEGNGAALVQLNQQYNIENVQEFRHFNIEAQPILKNEAECTLKLCYTYLTGGGISNDTANLMIIEVNLPSGFRCEAENFKNNDLVQRFETKNSESLVVLYLSNLMAEMRYCLEIEMYKIDEVMMTKPAAIVMYDSYNTTRSNTKFYSV